MSAFNTYHYIALSGAAVVSLFIVKYFSASIWSLSTRRASSKRAVERLRNLPRGEPREPLAAVSPEMPLTEPLEVQPAVNVPQPLSAKVQPILERAEQLKVQPAVNPEVPLPVGANVGPILGRAEPLVQPATNPELSLPVGSKVWAVCKFGSVPKGMPGIITGIADGRFFRQSPMYLCTFGNNRKVRARPKDIEAYNHAYSLQELEHPSLGSVQSRRMILRAEQFLSHQRPHPS